MKKSLIILTVLLSLLLTGCSNNDSQKIIKEGKKLITNKEYEEAQELLTLAMDDHGDDKEIRQLLELTRNYIKLLTLIDAGKFDSAEKIVKNMENNKSLDIMQDDFMIAKEIVVEYQQEHMDYIEEIEAIEKLLAENKIDEAKAKATAKLKEMKGRTVSEKRLNAVIQKADEIIANTR